MIDTYPSQATSEVHPIPVAITCRMTYQQPIDAVFTFITAEDVLPKILNRYGLVPGVSGTSDVSGPWDTPGSQRIVHLKDGSQVREQVTDFVPSTFFKYKIWGFSNPLMKLMSTGATGVWHFQDQGDHTDVQWTYTFFARNRIATVPLRLFARLFWRGYMDQCLRSSAVHLQATAAP